MKILLIVHDVYQNDNTFPLGIGYLSSIMKNAGHDVDIYCMDVYHYSNEQLAYFLKRRNYDMIGLSFMAARFKETIIDLCKVINKHKKRALLVLGGHGPSPIPEYMLDKVNADIVVVGEAENVILHVLDDMSTGNYKNIYKSKPIRDLDKLPFPNWDNFPMDIYSSCIKLPGMSNKDKALNIISSRGCTNACTFCYRMEKGIRLRKVPKIVEEIKELNKRYGINYIEFADECFILNKKRLESFYCELQDNNLDIKYLSAVRAEFADEDTLDLLKKSGCKFINYGFESMNSVVLKEMKKNTTPEQNETAAKLTKSKGIPFGLNFIWGYPSDTIETLNESKEFIKKYNDYTELRTIRPVTPYPGCELYYEAMSKRLLDGPDDFFNRFDNSDLITINFTEMETEDMYDMLYDVNKELIMDHMKHSNMNRLESTSIINNFYNLYFCGQKKFRGARHYEK